MSNGTLNAGAIAPNAMRLLWAGSLAIFAAAIGAGVRGGILANWAADFGFTGAQLGAIGGAGFTGFCFGIIIGGVVVDKIGYGKLVVAAFLFHVLSAFITFAATKGQAQNTAYLFLYIGTFVFALANGTLEAVANPLVSTLFPSNRTHYLNILHASWPAGLVVGGLIGWILGDGMQRQLEDSARSVPGADRCSTASRSWASSFPKSEASAKGLSVGEMMRDVGILGALVACFLIGLFFKDQLGGILGFFTDNPFFTLGDVEHSVAGRSRSACCCIVGLKTNFAIGSMLLFVLFITHLLVGAVELGTDGWIQNITGNILTPGAGQDPLRLHLAPDVLAALLRRLHRTAPQDLADRPAAHLLAAGDGRPAAGQRHQHLRRGDGGARRSTRSARRSSGRRCSRWSGIASRAPARWRCRSWAASA